MENINNIIIRKYYQNIKIENVSFNLPTKNRKRLAVCDVVRQIVT